MAIPYVGNPDFRGYLNYLGQQGDGQAANALNYTGNDGGINNGAFLQYVSGSGGGADDAATQAATKAYIGGLYTQFQNGGARTANLGAETGNGSAGASYNPADLAYLDTQSNNLKRMLQSADTGLNNGLTGLNDSFNNETNKANTQRTRALEDYSTQETDSANAKDQSLGQVDTNARTLNDSLRRILGMASGSGSSAYQLAAPNAVAREASGQRNNVLSNFGANSRDLTTAEDRATIDFQSLLDDLSSQRKSKEEGLRAGVLQNKNQINNQLADVAAQKSSLMGGGYSSAVAAQAPYTNAINANQSALDNLFAQFRTPYTVNPVNPKPVDLRDYTVDRQAINANNQSGGDQTTNSPYSYFLKRQQDQQNPVAG